MSGRYDPAELAAALGLHQPTEEQAAVIAAPPGPLVVIAGAGAGKTETMAARVVWLVANGYADPGQVLGLTFTRKAAGQLLRRVRSRLARLAGAGLMAAEPDRSGAKGIDGATATTPVVSTYHAFAGALLREHGLLLGIEPDTRLLTETGLWQLAFDVVSGYPGELDTDRDPAAVTAMVLRLAGQLAEHLVDTDALRHTHLELERLVHTLPPGPRQRAEPNQSLLKMLDTQTERAELVPLIEALHQRMRAERAMDFGAQMATAARLAESNEAVGARLRATYRVVLLDEYQDTGHAQRIALSSLFGGGVDDDLALTAVGDPIQSIYGWRGASATNLPRFATDFPLSDGSPAPTLELRTSWRNPPEVLHLANEISAEARRRSVTVQSLRPRPAAPPGDVRVALLPDVVTEDEWVAEALQRCYRQADADGVDPPTAAVLVRRNADAAPLAEAIRARGVPVEVVGLAGLLSVPEVADLVAMLRLIQEPTAGAAAMRVLTGPRWRFGAADLAALWRRAAELARPEQSGAPVSAAEIAATAGPDSETACLADALADPGPAERYSAVGYRRIVALAEELTLLRGHLWHPLPDLVAEVRRVLGLDCEVLAAQPVAASAAGTEQLDAFADVVAGYAEGAGAQAALPGLLAYLDAAAVVENGLAPAAPAVAADRVQILTVHAAKGLEWQVVAIPHLVARVFPSTASRRSWLSDASELPPLLRGDRAQPFGPGGSARFDGGEAKLGPRHEPGGSARFDGGEAKLGPPHEPGGSARFDGGEAKLGPPHEPGGSARFDGGEAKLGPPHEPGDHGVPLLDTDAVTNRKQLSDAISEHQRRLDQRRVDEERRLLYVAVTRAEDTLLISGHHWGQGEAKPRGPSDFLAEIKAVIDSSADEGTPCGTVEHWAQAPADGEKNPLCDTANEGVWPADPLDGRRGDVERGAALVAAKLQAGEPQDDTPSASRWAADVDALLAERATAATQQTRTLPNQLSVSGLVELSRDPDGAGQRLSRRLPARPDPHALLGTAFHDWVQRLYGAERLFELEDLPGAADADTARADAQELARLQAAFLESPWAARTPTAVEVPFEMVIGSRVVRGRIDAVFVERDGGVTVVDWKTGTPPDGPDARRHAAVQLGVYRLAWAALTGCPASQVRAAFHYVRSGTTVIADELPELADLAALLNA
ncbi:ATP-dependent helicase [Mycolicibacter virginiensis]|uniref:ATP-dependent helicase n=1 Tax=Mycolicibacter virginiensis TaxID=1795032 RepID=UPI001F0400DA|nr:UvrD-helicase domain-containing protein [Mycolicibacter virginiensis]ULP46437.1 UvrD-helicase domain-containing protein [Mycolicibacter virginiensis]